MMVIDDFEDIDKVKALLMDIEILFNNLDDIKKRLEQEQKIKEDEQEDWLHEIELGKLNRFDLIKVAKELERVRQERRNAKDKLKLLNTVKGYTDRYITKGIIAETRQVIINIETLEKELSSRVYKPRVVQDLKCAKKKETTNE